MAKNKKPNKKILFALAIAAIILFNMNKGADKAATIDTNDSEAEPISISSGGGGGGGGGISPPAYVPSAKWCYQETANESSIVDGTCSLNYSGGYWWDDDLLDPQDAIDGSILTYAVTNDTASIMTIGYINPPDYTTNSLWNVCDGNITAPPYCINLTIPSECWGLELWNITGYPNGTKAIGVGVISYNDTTATAAEWICLNASSINMTTGNWTGNPLISLRYVNGSNSGRIYEEAMWWEIFN